MIPRWRAALLLLFLLFACVAVLACRNTAAPTAAAEQAPSARPTSPPLPAQPTYTNSIATILDTHCTSCHARGGIGPMPLSTFSDAHDYATQIAKQTQTKAMPPWLPDTHACAPLEHSRALSDDEIAAIGRWAKSGAPEGAPSDRRPIASMASHSSFEAVTGPPSRVAIPEIAYAPKRAGRSDDYHCFVLDPKLEKTERVTALRIAPGAPAVVHHVILYEVRKSAAGKIRALDDAEPGPGYTCFGGIGVEPTIREGKQGSGSPIDFDSQMIVAWAPGAGATDVAGAPTALPEGTAIQLAEGSQLVMQVHYSLENLQPTMTDRTQVEMWFAGDNEVRRQAVWVPIFKFGFDVPKGAGPDDPRSTARADVTLPFPLTVLGIAPHMHLRGKSARIEALGENGRDHGRDHGQCLLDVPKWNFHHQEAYWLEQGVRVERVALTCQWDNRDSAQPVVAGRRRATKELRWGEGTDDEMCLSFLYATPTL